MREATAEAKKSIHETETDLVIAQSPQKTETISETIEELGTDLFFLAASPVMLQLEERATRVAGVDIPVLLLGESGTGKEILARLIHQRSPRRERMFHKVN